ncbi:hypothetical protein OAS25_05045 [Alphaproteobacteria bacterium]|nr:hypothetical protein [Alphaproteobacteria bacterium]
MISRFNLDLKRLNYYDDIEKFNQDFTVSISSNNKSDQTFNLSKPSVLINKDKTLKMTVTRNEKEFNYILFSNHSISLLPVEKIMIHKALKEASNFEFYDLNSE